MAYMRKTLRGATKPLGGSQLGNMVCWDAKLFAVRTAYA